MRQWASPTFDREALPPGQQPLAVLPCALPARSSPASRSPATTSTTRSSSSTTSRTISYWRFLVRSDFGQAVLENWQSEYLQFLLFILATVWFVQQGSPESKKPGNEGRETDKEQRVGAHAAADSPRWARRRLAASIYANSLLLVMGGDLPRDVARPVGDGVDARTTTSSWSTGSRRVAGSSTSARRTSGSGRCRTGSRSSSPWARWPSSRSTCASAGRRSPSPSARRTRRPAAPVDVA